VLGERGHVLGVVVSAEDAAVNFGVKRLDAAVHHFGKSGVLGDVADGDAGVGQVTACTASAEQLNAERRELMREF